MKARPAGLGPGGQNVRSMVALLGAEATVGDRLRLERVLLKYDFDAVRSAVDLGWSQRALAPRMREWLLARQRLRDQLKAIVADAQILETAPEVVPLLEHAILLLALPRPPAKGRPPAANRKMMERLLVVAGVTNKEDRRFLLKILAKLG